MAVHIRTQIRKALGAALKGLPTTAARVRVNRPAAFAASDLPMLVISTPAESLSQITMDAPQRYRREMQIEIEGFATGNARDDVLDQIGAEVESAVYAAGTLGGLVKAGLVLSATRMELDDLSSPPVGVLRMQWNTTTFTAANAPDTVT
jgi:hypothetical protein